MKHILLIILGTLSIFHTHAARQHTDANLFGDVQSDGKHIPFATIFIEGTTIGTTTDETGHYMLIDLPIGTYIVVAKALGFEAQKKAVEFKGENTLEINFELKAELMSLDEVVVTGTKTFKRQTDAPVIVNVLDSKSIEAVQACNISEGLRFQPGLRVETDCQTCSYSQLRMNGLGGGYSQILINGRPIFSPLIGLYGMEQMPANMVDRIEVVRGGGSALYGSSAIGGTVNVITKIPTKNSYGVSLTSHSIDAGAAMDNVINGNVNMVSRKRNAGAVIFVNNRTREAYDAKGLSLQPDGSTIREKDNYSELPELRNNSFGANLFYRLTPNQKVELNFTSMHEYRYGGEMVQKQAHLAQQSEERVHNILMGGLDYQWNFNDDNSSLISYVAGQYTDRDHYTGLYPVLDDFNTDAEFLLAEQIHLRFPAYGYTYNTTAQGGLQFNHRIQNLLTGPAVITVGGEHVYDDVLDSIPIYKYGTDQETHNTAFFLQNDWQVISGLTILLGLRGDKHNLVGQTIFSPRASVLYKLKNTQLRATWGTGFRAPQAFDTDMHIAFAGGGISRIELAPDLHEERSNSISGSINMDVPHERYIYGFTLEGFYTQLDDAFYLQPIEADALGDRFEKRNGPGAMVQGATLELRANYNKRVQVEGGITLQRSEHREAVEHIEGLEAKKEFLRTPDQYGYAILTLNPSKRWSASLSSIYTGTMIHAKFSPNEDWLANEYRRSEAFTELNLKMGYTLPVKNMDSGIEFFGGIKNITNVFQDDFDNGRNRDSNYIYGPALPRTVYVGIKLKSL